MSSGFSRLVTKEIDLLLTAEKGLKTVVNARGKGFIPTSDGASVQICNEKNGAENRNRTYDLRVTSALLYRLSYFGVASGAKLAVFVCSNKLAPGFAMTPCIQNRGWNRPPCSWM